VLPGFVDCHVHLRDFEEAYKETIETGTRAAASGGFTMVLEMPNTKPPITTPNILAERWRTIEDRAWIPVGTLAMPLNPASVRAFRDLGVRWVKLYVDRFENWQMIDQVLSACCQAGFLVAVHTEEEGTASSELANAARVLTWTRRGLQVHICHVSLPQVAQLVSETRGATCEVTPHHLLLSSRDAEQLGPVGVVRPPLRSPEAVSRLHILLRRGAVHVIASDHAPHTLEEKMSENPPPGFPNLEVVVPLLLTEWIEGRLPLATLVRCLAQGPRVVYKLPGQGRLAKGELADLTIVEVNREWRIDPSRFISKARYSPFAGWRVLARVWATVVRGKIVYLNGEFVERAGCVVR